jgi:hypothetical protein
VRTAIALKVFSAYSSGMTEDYKAKFELYRTYLQDVASVLKSMSLDAKKLVNGTDPTSEDYPARLAESFALTGVISLMQNEADACGIDLQEINLHDIDHDHDLLGL